ncbi:MAG: hypothetical protein QOC97_933, partial [Chloroflexota bacterium]|nr:hypothetical protein [Chloroflexota bacterium]
MRSVAVQMRDVRGAPYCPGMTILISIGGFIFRFAEGFLTTSLGWASNLMFGRVPRSHQVFVNLMFAGSLLWLFLLIGFLA